MPKFGLGLGLWLGCDEFFVMSSPCDEFAVISSSVCIVSPSGVDDKYACFHTITQLLPHTQ